MGLSCASPDVSPDWYIRIIFFGSKSWRDYKAHQQGRGVAFVFLCLGRSVHMGPNPFCSQQESVNESCLAIACPWSGATSRFRSCSVLKACDTLVWSSMHHERIRRHACPTTHTTSLHWQWLEDKVTKEMNTCENYDYLKAVASAADPIRGLKLVNIREKTIL